MNIKKIVLSSSLLAVVAPLLPTGLAHAEVNQPQQILDRGRVLPQSELEARLDLGFTRVAAGTSTTTVTGTTLGVGYGIAEKLELRLNYGFTIDPSSSGKGPLGIAVGYSVLNTGPLSMAVGGGLGYNVGPGELTPLQLGADVQFKLGEKMALFTPGRQLSIGLAGSSKPITLGLPVGFRYQAAPNVFTEVSTTIVSLGLSHANTTVFGADFVPVNLGAVYSLSNAIDLGVTLSDDLKAAGDTFGLGVFGRLYL
jgi:hypothetical protein